MSGGWGSPPPPSAGDSKLREELDQVRQELRETRDLLLMLYEAKAAKETTDTIVPAPLPEAKLSLITKLKNWWNS